MLFVSTVNPLYTDIRYHEKNRYNDDLTGTEAILQISKTYVFWGNNKTSTFFTNYSATFKESLQEENHFNSKHLWEQMLSL